jgi:glycosyltransferase involved in cell wall biosynthesis
MTKTVIKSASLPTIECLMVTLPIPERLAYAQRSIDDYCRQTYPNKKLVLVHDSGPEDAIGILHNYITSLGRNDIKVVAVEGKLNLGELRNLSIENAASDIVCQWDDDDRSHPKRLEAQAAFLQAGELDAAYLQDVMQYSSSTRELYWTNWRATPAGAHPGTLMAWRTPALRYPIKGAAAKLGEDLALAMALKKQRAVGYLADMAYLFVYVSHGSNSWDDAHHQMLIKELSISKGLLKKREAVIREGLMAYGFASNTITVTGSNGPAFNL